MNRKQIRDGAKNGDFIHFMAVDAYVQNRVNSELRRAVKEYSAVMAYCLHTHLKFGHQRCAGFLTAVADTFAEISKKNTSVPEIEEKLKKIGVLID
jgi:erythromycin esterase-like protein